MNPAYLEGRDVVVERGGKTVIDGADFTLRRGLIATLGGPSGGGKSTFLRALARLIPLKRGLILFHGEDANALPPRVYRTRVAYVPQQAPMFEGTVGDNLSTGPRFRGESLPRIAMTEVLGRVGLASTLVDRIANTLSGGEKQRVGFARALVNRPEVMLLDEPTAGLDNTSSSVILDLVQALGRSGLGVLLVTHIEKHAAAVGDVHWECRNGKLLLMEAPS